MTPRQVLAEIIRDYRFNMAKGMTEKQALETLKIMVLDVIEFEKEKAAEIGIKAGRSGLYHEIWLKAIQSKKMSEFEALTKDISTS